MSSSDNSMMKAAILKMPTSLREVVAQAALPTSSSRKEATEEDEDAIALLPEGEKDEAPSPASSQSQNGNGNGNGGSFINGRTRKTWLLIALVGIGLLVAAFMLPSRRRPPPPPQNDNWRDTEFFFHMVLPTTASSANVCKMLLSAAALNYPSPWLINWDWNGDAVEDRTLLKMRAVAGWLEAMPPEREDDPVMILGDVEAWFQVRPDVLLERYFAIQRRGDDMIKETFKKKVIKKQGLKTRIVFSSERDCQLTEENQSGCLGVAAEDGSLHYLSTNLVIGPLKDMRALWRHATDHAEEVAASQGTVDENKLFAQLLGDQETHRASIQKSWTNEHFKVSDKGEEDFGIMLDLGRELSYAADDKLQGVEWVKHAGEVDDEDLTVPADIAASTPPFWTFEASGELPNATWADVPLLTGLRANIVPATVQRGPKAASELADTWWEKMWFQPYGRQLLDAFALIPSAPLAILGEDRFWSPHLEKVGAKDEMLNFHNWTELCGAPAFAQQVAKAVFLDGEGEWVDPRP